MPEGDVVWRTARRLNTVLAGAELLHTDFRIPRLATADLSGQTVQEVISRGKHLLTRIDGGWTLHTHLEMDGEWRLAGASRTSPRHPDVRVVLSTQSWHAVGYRLPLVALVPTATEADAVGHLGPDLLGMDWDEAEALDRLAAGPDREIADALLDQRNLAGIGNLYKSEALFLSGISPWRPVGELQNSVQLVRLARRLLDANKDRTGQVTTGLARRGEETWVYGRAGHPCRRCGTRIKRADQGEPSRQRVTFWCPHCQPG